MRLRRAAAAAALLAALALVAGCDWQGKGTATGNGPQRSLTLYTCISDSTIQPVIKAFEDRYPNAHVDLFRAPTGQLNARVAGDVRAGGLKADVIWACDPLTMAAWVGQGLVGGWVPPGDDAVPAQYRTDDYVGASLLYVVAAHRTDVPAPPSWSDLAGPAYTGAVAVPDPSVAASAFGALGWFASDPDYGIAFYEHLKANGAVQVSTPDDVTTGVAQGKYKAGITIAASVKALKADGSPVDAAWPQPGAIAIYKPIALAEDTRNAAAAKQFISYVVSQPGQEVIAKSGSYPVLKDVQNGPQLPQNAPIVHPDWPMIAANHSSILADYQRVFGGS